MSKILSMLELENFSGEQLRKIVIQITFICTLLLFGVTGWVQFSCYPMVTVGSLPECCNNQTTKLNIIKDQRTHGNVLINLASDPNSDEDVLTALMSSLDSPRVANNPRILERAIAFNPKTPTDALEALTKSEDVAILSQIVARQNATPDVLRKVANNPAADVYTVQKAFVDNSKTPEDVLQKIALSKEVKILGKVIKHPQVSVEVLRTVADNSAAKDVRIQQMLASNSNGIVFQKLKFPSQASQLGMLIDLIESHYPGAAGRVSSILLNEFEYTITEDKKNFSGGEESLIFFAIAQASSPKLLILDEPTSNLDENNRNRIWDFLRRFSEEGNTVLFACHDKDIPIIPTKTFLLENGQLSLLSENKESYQNLEQAE